MGFNALGLGYPSINSFVAEMHDHERQHLDACRRFIELNGLVDALRLKDWETFAEGYNGPGFRENKYHLKLEKAYLRYAS